MRLPAPRILLSYAVAVAGGGALVSVLVVAASIRATSNQAIAAPPLSEIVTAYDADKVDDSYVLFAPFEVTDPPGPDQGRAYLVHKDGSVAHTWELPTVPGGAIALFPNGDLMVMGRTAAFRNREMRALGIRAAMVSGLWAAAAAFAGMSFMDGGTPYPVLAALLVLLGIGLANLMAPAKAAVINSVPGGNAGVGSALNDTAQTGWGGARDCGTGFARECRLLGGPVRAHIGSRRARRHRTGLHRRRRLRCRYGRWSRGAGAA